MMQWDFTFEHRLELEREEGREKGREEGREQEVNEIMEVARAIRKGASNKDLKKKYRKSTIAHAGELLKLT